MNGFKERVTAYGIVACMAALATSCNDQNTASGINGSNDKQDTNLVDTQRNSSDTINYLTKDSGNASQDVIDPNPPTNSH